MNFENRVRISVLDAGRILLKHLAAFPETKPADAARQLSFGPSYLANYDFEAAGQLVANSERAIFRLTGDRPAELRHAIFEIIRLDRPFWARAAIYGRQRALKLIDQDQKQCLADAGLINSPLEGEPREWWKRLANEFRLLQQAEQCDIGSEAERLTIEYEENRLASLGISRKPHLISVEDETVGYDVYSYIQHGETIVPYYIEVKGTTAVEPRFFISRNEWKACASLRSTHAFYIWDLSSEKLTILTFDTLRDHVPEDHGAGVWMDTRFILSSLTRA